MEAVRVEAARVEAAKIEMASEGGGNEIENSDEEVIILFINLKHDYNVH